MCLFVAFCVCPLGLYPMTVLVTIQTHTCMKKVVAKYKFLLQLQAHVSAGETLTALGMMLKSMTWMKKST